MIGLELVEQYGAIAAVLLTAVFTVFFMVRAAGTAHLKTVTADGETQSAVTLLALEGNKRVNQLLENNKELADLRVKLAKMEGDIRVLKEKELRIPVLEQQIEDLTAQITALQEDYISKLEILEGKYADERTQNTFLMEENAKLHDQIAALQARVTELETQLNRIKNGEGNND